MFNQNHWPPSHLRASSASPPKNLRAFLGFLTGIFLVATSFELSTRIKPISKAQRTTTSPKIAPLKSGPPREILAKEPIKAPEVKVKAAETQAKKEIYAIIFGSYPDKEQAQKHRRILEKQGLSKVIIRKTASAKKTFYVVQSKPFRDPQVAQLRSSQLRNQSIQNFVVKL